ncbi:MAG: RHS repeat-associated core domain-containing protein [Cyclobacteriaceae bacterium]
MLKNYPFGLSSSSYQRTASLLNPYLYNQGSRLEEETEWYNTAFRKYDASIGRFTAVDPLAASMASINSYHYGYNNPVNFSDALGLMPESNGNGNPTPYADNSGQGGGGGSGLGAWLGQRQRRMGWSMGTGFNSDGSFYDPYAGEWDLRKAAKDGDAAAQQQYGGKYGEDNVSASEFLASSFEWIEVFMADMLPDGSGLAVEGQGFHVYTNPTMISAVMNYYFNQYGNIGNSGGWVDDGGTGGVVLTRSGGGEAVTYDGHPSHEIDIDTTPGLNGGGNWGLQLSLWVAKKLGLGKKPVNAPAPLAPTAPVPFTTDTLVNRRLDFIAEDGATPMIKIDSIFIFNIGPADTISNTIRYDQIDF